MKRYFILFAMVCVLFCAVNPATSFAAATKSAVETEQQMTKVDINSADVELLATIPGIGPKTAEAITSYRKDNGKFSSVDDLLNVKGIGEKKLAKMRPFLKQI